MTGRSKCVFLLLVLFIAPQSGSCQQWPPPIDADALVPREEVPSSPWIGASWGDELFSGVSGFRLVPQLEADFLVYQGYGGEWAWLVSADKKFVSGYDHRWAPFLGYKGDRRCSQSPTEEWRLATNQRVFYNEQGRHIDTEGGLFLYDLISADRKKLPVPGSFGFPQWGNDGKMYFLYGAALPENFFWSPEGREQVAKAKREGIWYWGQTLARVDESGTLEKLVELPSNPEWRDLSHEHIPIRTAYGLLSVSPDCKYAVLDASRLCTRDILYLVCIPEKKIVEMPTKGGTFCSRTCWSPDSKELAFSDDDGVHIVSPADLTKKRTILPPAIKGGSKTFSCGKPDSWSPDGKWIVMDGGLYNQGWFLLSPDGATRKDILRKFVKHRYPDNSYDFCFPQGIAYSTWSKDSRFLAGCVMQGQIHMKGGKVQDGYSWHYFIVVDLAKREFALYDYADDHYHALLLFEDKEVIEKIRAARVPENDKYYAKLLERSYFKKFREGDGIGPVDTYGDDAEKWWAYLNVLTLAYRKDSFSQEFRDKLLVWLRENKEDFERAYGVLKKRGKDSYNNLYLALDRWIPPIPEE